jgi:hypothetical protein
VGRRCARLAQPRLDNLRLDALSEGMGEPLLADIQGHMVSHRKTRPQNLRQRWRNLPHVDGPEISTASDAGSCDEKCCVHFRIFR